MRGQIDSLDKLRREALDDIKVAQRDSANQLSTACRGVQGEVNWKFVMIYEQDQMVKTRAAPMITLGMGLCYDSTLRMTKCDFANESTALVLKPIGLLAIGD